MPFGHCERTVRVLVRFPKGGPGFPQATLLESGVKPPHSKALRAKAFPRPSARRELLGHSQLSLSLWLFSCLTAASNTVTCKA